MKTNVRVSSEWSKVASRSAAIRRSIEKLLKDATDLASTQPLDAITGHYVWKKELEAWSKETSEFGHTANRILEALHLKQAEEAGTYDERLSRSLRAAGLDIHGETGLFVAEGVVHVETDIRKAVVIVNGVRSSSLLIDDVCKDVKVAATAMKRYVSQPADFLASLAEAYEIEIAASKRSFGTQVNVSQLIYRIALLRQQPQFRTNPTSANFKDYPRDVFRADLFTLFASNLRETSGRRFSFASGSDTAGAVFMFVPQLGRTAHVGRIWFEYCEA